MAGLREADLTMVARPNPRLGLTRWLKSEGRSATLVIHALNYGVAPGFKTGDPVEPLRNLRLRVPLPAGMKAVRAEAYEPLPPTEAKPAPGEAKHTLSFRQLGPGRIELTVDELPVYQLIAIMCSK